MNKNLIYIFLLIFGTLIAYVILGDTFRGDSKKNSENPYAYDLGDIKEVDPSMIKYGETKRIKVSFPEPKAVDYNSGQLLIGYSNHLQLIDTSGREYFNHSLNENITSLTFAPDGSILLGCKDHVQHYDRQGNLIKKWGLLDSTSYITSIACKDEIVFIADAAGPKVYRYNYEGDRLSSFDGTGRVENDFGFIIPSPYFDLDIDPDGALWVANAGLQYLENYTDSGSLRAFWGESSFALDGFTGCCNPAQFTIMSNGNFVTCEKGLVRIKVYLPSGELESVVAAPAQFINDSEPADLTSDEDNKIYALDISRNVIRKFERKNI